MKMKMNQFFLRQVIPAQELSSAECTDIKTQSFKVKISLEQNKNLFINTKACGSFSVTAGFMLIYLAMAQMSHPIFSAIQEAV